MVNVPIPSHVFVSYSHDDKEYVDKITTELENAGISVWIDRTGLRPGTPNWNTTIREAITRSFALLLIASPSSGQSNVVQGELAVARNKGCPIFPIWVRGDAWMDCVPLDMVQTQYIDCRNVRYSQGLSQVIEILKAARDTHQPKHSLFTSLFLSEQKSKGPLLTPLWSQEYEPIYLLNSDVVAIKVNDYSSLQSLLNDLYVHYLKDSYNPYTYGRDWVLGYEIHVDKKLSITRLLVPWNWLLRSDNQPLSHSDPSWAASAPEAYGLKANVGEMGWRIIDGLPGPTFGIATNSPDIASIIRNESRSAKEALTTRFEFGIILSLLAVGDIGPSISLEDPHLVHPGDYKFLFVMNPRARDYPQFERKAIVFKGYLKADSN